MMDFNFRTALRIRTRLRFWSVLCALLVSSTLAAEARVASFAEQLAEAAVARTEHRVRYDGAYRKIPFPMGDVPANIGVCTDVVIRAYRSLGIDLQALVHADMRRDFARYPSRRIWGLTAPDSNIDHRRVPNLQVFFAREGQELPISDNKDDYRPGDIVTWMLAGNLPHIGIIVADEFSETYKPLVVHNIGAGPKREDVLFSYSISGHYRFHP